jgi:hypothetical protein
MGWASAVIRKLKNGETVTLVMRTKAMTGVIDWGDKCRIEPVRKGMKLKVGDIVLCKVYGKEHLQKILYIDEEDGRIQIGNHRGRVEGFAAASEVYGRFCQIEE